MDVLLLLIAIACTLVALVLNRWEIKDGTRHTIWNALKRSRGAFCLLDDSARGRVPALRVVEGPCPERSRRAGARYVAFLASVAVASGSTGATGRTKISMSWAPANASMARSRCSSLGTEPLTRTRPVS